MKNIVRKTPILSCVVLFAGSVGTAAYPRYGVRFEGAHNSGIFVLNFPHAYVSQGRTGNTHIFYLVG